MTNGRCHKSQLAITHTDGEPDLNRRSADYKFQFKKSQSRKMYASVGKYALFIDLHDSLFKQNKSGNGFKSIADEI